MKFLKEKGMYLIAILFIIWIIISSFWYVCGIKGFCQDYNNKKEERNIVKEEEIYNNDEDEEEIFRPIQPTRVTKVINKKVTTKKVIECDTYLKTELNKNQFKSKTEVIKLQNFLNEFSDEDLVVDGVYGDGTLAAVERFQKKHLDRIDNVSGYVGTQTRNEINSEYCVAEFNKINNSKIKK